MGGGTWRVVYEGENWHQQEGTEIVCGGGEGGSVIASGTYELDPFSLFVVSALPPLADGAAPDAATGRLIEIGAIVRDDRGYALTPGWAWSANRLAFPERFAVVTTRHEREDTIDEDEVYACATAAASLIVVVDPDTAGTLHLGAGPVAMLDDLVVETFAELRPIRDLLDTSTPT